MDDLILVTDWEKVDKDDYYLTDENKNEDKEILEEARKSQAVGKLYEAFIVQATNYAIYWQMDADKVYINEDGDIIMNAESAVIGNNHKHRELYKY